MELPTGILGLVAVRTTFGGGRSHTEVFMPADLGELGFIYDMCSSAGRWRDRAGLPTSVAELVAEAGAEPATVEVHGLRCTRELRSIIAAALDNRRLDVTKTLTPLPKALAS